MEVVREDNLRYIKEVDEVDLASFVSCMSNKELYWKCFDESLRGNSVPCWEDYVSFSLYMHTCGPYTPKHIISNTFVHLVVWSLLIATNSSYKTVQKLLYCTNHTCPFGNCHFLFNVSFALALHFGPNSIGVMVIFLGGFRLLFSSCNLRALLNIFCFPEFQEVEYSGGGIPLY